MLRSRFTEGLKDAMRAKNERAVGTLRLIIAALKDRDIAARGKGNHDGISEEEIAQMLHSMIKTRRESITLYEQGNRLELAEQEREEIAIIETFLPKQLGEAEVTAAIKAAITEVGATGIKDMGKVMAVLKAKHAGKMDFSKASAAVKQLLG
ncbi:MAG: GatB/YqeY domain-containing protein [Alphaproteobacteria bacterium]|nr:GatB/YqeY domain-containing protein [Alphaproteobacteria bacterium]